MFNVYIAIRICLLFFSPPCNYGASQYFALNSLRAIKIVVVDFFLFLLIKTFLLFFSSFFIFYQPSSHELCLIVVTHRKFTNETTIFVSSNTRQAETFKIRYRFSFLLNRIRWIGLHLIVEHLVKMRRNWYSSEALAIQMNFQFYKQSRWNRECDTKGREREIESDRDKER